MAVELLEQGPPHEVAGASSHVGEVEGRIRRLKGNYRSLQAGLLYNMGNGMACWCMKYRGYVLNLLPMLHSNRSPREILTGQKPNFKYARPFRFGDLVHVKDKVVVNDVTVPRTVAALALMPSAKLRLEGRSQGTSLRLSEKSQQRTSK